MRNSASESHTDAQEQPNTDYSARRERDKVNPTWQSVYELKPERVAGMADVAGSFRNAFIFTFILTLAILVIPSALIRMVLATAAVLYGGRFFYTSAWRALRRGTTNAAVLVSLAVLIAYAYGIATFVSTPRTIFFEVATVVLTIVLFGHWMETLVWERITDPVQSLQRSLPSLAIITTDGAETIVPLEEVHAGDSVLIREGDTIPADGIIIEGYGLVDESLISGNWKPAEKDLRDDVFAGTVNLAGTFTMKVTRTGGATVIAQMARIAEDAQRTRAPMQQSVEMAASYFIPAVIIAAALAAIIGNLVADKGLAFALITAIATLTIAGPDALSLSVPTAMLVAVGVGLRRGILIKTTMALERAALIDTVVFSKTGCLTEGIPRVSDIYHVGTLTEPGFLRLTAGLEKGSKSNIAKAIVMAAEERVSISIPTPEEHRQMPGYGTVGKVETRTILVGNKRLMAEKDINTIEVEQKAGELAKQGKTIVYVAVDGKIEGIIGVYDPVRPSSKEAVEKLHDTGRNVILITDDNYTTAKAIADEVGIEKVYAEVPVAAKADIINELQHKGRHVAAVSASRADSSALGKADIGIAFMLATAPGSEPGQVVLIKNDPIDVVTVLDLGKSVATKIKWNLGLAIAYNTVALAVAVGVFYLLTGLALRPEIAAVTASLSTLAVMANSLRLRKSPVTPSKIS